MHKIVAAFGALALGGLVAAFAACNDSSSPTTSTAPSSTASRVKQDLKATGQDIKNVGDDIARKADPEIEKAKEEAKGTLHRAAEKVADMTASTEGVPTTAPTQP